MKCVKCVMSYDTVKEFIEHKDKMHPDLHGISEMPSNPHFVWKEAPVEQINKPKRIRRKAMDAATFARFCNRAASVLNKVQAEFDPSTDEMEKMLYHLAKMVEWLKPTTNRRIS